MIEARPLQPLTHGNVLIVGAKASNFDDEIKTNPRVILWDSQDQRWVGKDLPVNVRAVFVTRFIGHNSFDMIIAEARKRHITIFNPDGTGKIARQVRELLAIKSEPETIKPEEPVTPTPALKPVPAPKFKAKLTPLAQFIDWEKGGAENARHLLEKAKELGIETTFGSLAQFVLVLRRGQKKIKVVQTNKMDVSVAVLDEAIKQLKDVRDYLIATTKENTELKARISKLKKSLED